MAFALCKVDRVSNLWPPRIPHNAIMQTTSTFRTATALVLIMAAPAVGQTASHNVAIHVGAVSIIALKGTTALTVLPHKAGTARTRSTASASYAITTNEDNRELSASIDEPLPEGVTLVMTVAAPAGGTSYSVNLSTSPQAVVTGISRVAASGLAISYTMVTASGARIPTSAVRNVMMTIGAAGDLHGTISATP